jgi:hypothetical protein
VHVVPTHAGTPVLVSHATPQAPQLTALVTGVAQPPAFGGLASQSSQPVAHVYWQVEPLHETVCALDGLHTAIPQVTALPEEPLDEPPEDPLEPPLLDPPPPGAPDDEPLESPVSAPAASMAPLESFPGGLASECAPASTPTSGVGTSVAPIKAVHAAEPPIRRPAVQARRGDPERAESPIVRE